MLRFIVCILGIPYRLLRRILLQFSFFRFVKETQATQVPATLELWLIQNVVGIGRGIYWPVHPTSRVVCAQNILIGVETSPGLMNGCYIQGIGRIRIGDYTQIAANVGIISANHVLTDSRAHVADEVNIGAYCWIGMGAVVLPGVVLGDFTVVGAGSIVTRSFPEGHCVIAGNPARKIADIAPADCVRHKSPHEYIGYIRKEDFDAFREKHLTL
jgi:acetyltransferase-like isoleucine patch superfamily enzyme